MNLPHIVFFFTLLVFSVRANTVDPKIEAAYNFVRDTCNKSEELKDLCNSVIDSNPRQDLKSNLTGLLAIFVNQTLQAVIHDHSYLQSQIAHGHLDNLTQKVFISCMDQYQMSKDSLELILKEALVKQKSGDLNMDLGQIDNYLDLCEMDFEGFTPEPSAWKSRYDYVNSLLILSLRMTNLITCNHIHVC